VSDALLAPSAIDDYRVGYEALRDRCAQGERMVKLAFITTSKTVLGRRDEHLKAHSHNGTQHQIQRCDLAE
jgi:hypothetical protein